MSKLTAAALEARTLKRQFQSLMLVGEALEEIGNIEKYTDEANRLKKEASMSYNAVKEALVSENVKLKRAKELVKEADDRVDSRHLAADEEYEAVLVKARSEAMVVLNEARDETADMLSVLTEKRESFVAANNILEAENKSLQSSYVKLKKEMDALKARF